AKRQVEMLGDVLREARVGIAGEHHQPVERGAVHPGVHRGHSKWLGRKDSNPRMPESKSGALTSLATPQLSNWAGRLRAPESKLISPVIQRMPIEPRRHESAHPGRQLGVHRRG